MSIKISRSIKTSSDSLLRTLLTLVVGGTLLLAGTQALAQTVILDRVVAIVDEDLVLESELFERMEAVVERLQAQYGELPPEDVLRRQILEQLIIERIQLRLARLYEIEMSKEDIDEAVERVLESNRVTLAQLEEDLHRRGMDMPTFRRQIHTDLTINQLQQGMVHNRIRVTEQEVDNFLASTDGKFATSPDYRVGHILIAVSGAADPAMVSASEKEAEDIYTQLQQGADFSQLAISHSNDQSALQGGDLGWRKLAQLPELFSNRLSDLKVGEVSKPFRSGAGFHLIKNLEQRGGGEQLIEQTLSRHILIQTSEIVNDEQARDKLLALKKRIEAGEDFAKLARENSEDTGSMLAGGDLGWSMPGMFVAAFDAAMNKTAMGEISEPFQSPFGWHILQVQDRRKEDMSEQVKRNQASHIIRSRRFEEEFQIWLTQIREEAYVEIKI
jgi:peptidyl-prolyl cis-trans isomerase SurA